MPLASTKLAACARTQIIEPSLRLLSLPDLALVTVVKCLNKADKLALARSCRMLAMAVSTATPDAELTVSSSTRWKGLCKVLTTNTITCKTVRLDGWVGVDVKASGNSALDVFMRHDVVPDCSFKGVTKAIIHAGPLLCILPPNVQRLLPDLESVVISGGLHRYGHLLPIPYCSSLRRLAYSCCSQQLLPSRYHTAEDLRRQLPNIDTLQLDTRTYAVAKKDMPRHCASVMLQAWGHQLTQLQCKGDIETGTLQQCRWLQSLIYTDSRCGSLMNVLIASPDSLTMLELREIELEEPELQVILELSSLRFLALQGFYSISNDWSNHPCTWQKLETYEMRMVDLSKLPMHSLEGQGCFKISVLELPDPLLPNSLADVTYAAQCVSNAGITIEGLEYLKWNNKPANSGNDTAHAEVVRAASRVVQPPRFYKISMFDLAHFPKTTAALITWLSPTLQDLHIKGRGEPPQPWLWQELQRCWTLKGVHVLDGYTGAGVCIYQDAVLVLVQLAAEHYVAVTKRPLKLAFSGWRGCKNSPKQSLQQEIQQKLPSCVRLQEYDWEECPGCRSEYCDWDVCGNCLTMRLVPAGHQQHGHLAKQMRNLNFRHVPTFM